MDHESILPILSLEHASVLTQSASADHNDLRLDACAWEVMIDLKRENAAVTSPTTSLQQAEQLMSFLNVQLFFVVSEIPGILGLVTTTDLHGERQMSLVHQRNSHYEDLTVADVMTPLDQLAAVDFDRLGTATVRDVIATLKRFGRNHLLVAQQAIDGSPPLIRGVLSRARIEQRTGAKIVITPIAASFSEIRQVIA